MKRIEPAEINGSITAPPSKSMMQRVLIASALATGKTTITNSSFCDDSLATINAIRILGARVELDDEYVEITGGNEPAGGIINCGESGTCLRMISPVAALFDKKFTMIGKGSLLKRPVGMLEQPLRLLGAKCESNNGVLPLKIKGPIHGGIIEVDGSQSSQHISGLLMALPLCNNNSEVIVKNMTSVQYIALTEFVQQLFGVRIKQIETDRFLINGNQEYKSRTFEIEGDWSGTAFMLVAGAIAGKITVNKIGIGYQADEAIKSVLIEVGANVKSEPEKRTITVEKIDLKSFEFDATNCPDLFPPLAVLACNCKGKSIIHGTERLKHKESDRAAALVSELGKMGANIKVVGNEMEIVGKKLIGGVTIDPHNDHRIAMACAIAALTSETGVQIKDEKCVSKSYPTFFEDLEKLMVRK